MGNRRARTHAFGRGVAPWALVLCVSLGCVPAREHRAALARIGDLESAQASLSQVRQAAEERALMAEGAADRSERIAQRLRRDSAAQASSLRSTREALARREAQVRELESASAAQAAGGRRETGRLLGELSRAQDDLQAREDALKASEAALHSRSRALALAEGRAAAAKRAGDSALAVASALAEALTAREGDISRLEREIASRDSAAQALKDRVRKALYGYEGHGLNVRLENGRVYVTLSEKLLFDPGKYEVLGGGQKPLKELAEALRGTDVRVVVEGHTDITPLRSATPPRENWELSALRAAVVARLLEGYGVLGSRITASGFGSHRPRYEGRGVSSLSGNRRVEVVLGPSWESLGGLLGGG